MKALNVVLFIGLSTAIYAQGNEKVSNPWSPWDLQCESIPFPSRELAYAFLGNKKFDVYSCFAQQKSQTFVRGRWVAGIVYVRPVSITFEVSPLSNEIKKPAKVLIENNATMQSFDVYDNCIAQTDNSYSCSFFLEDKNQIQQMIQAMSQAKQLKLELRIPSFNVPIELVFNTKNLPELYKIVSATYDQMRDIFATANVSGATFS